MFFCGTETLHPQLPKRYSRCSCHVKRIHIVRHGNLNGKRSAGYRFCWQTVTFCTHYQCKSRRSFQFGMIKRDGIVRQCHGSGTESQCVQRIHRLVNPCPGNKENTSHRNPHRSSVQRITRIARYQHSINAKSCSRTEYGANISRIHHSVYHYNPSRITTYIFYSSHPRSLHGTKHASGQRIPCQL